MSSTASRDVRAVLELLPLLADDDIRAPQVARTIAELLRGMTPVQLSWLDERVRRGSYVDYNARSAWQKLAPGAVPRLAQAVDFDSTVIGLIASHANGFVRAAAIEVLAQQGDGQDGQELPFLSLRANDWVEPVAARATVLLTSRLRPDNRHAVLTALPFIVRLLRQRRRDHGAIERALRDVLLWDGAADALARGTGFATTVRRTMYELLLRGETAAAVRRRVIGAALSDVDGVIRARAIRSVAADTDFDERPAILERLLRDDPVPAVRRLALALLSEYMPERVAGLFPDVLLDRAASVRALARFVARTQQLPFVPRDIYVQSLAAGGVISRPIGAAIDGLGETGTRPDAELVAPFLISPRPRYRRSALRALARLDADRVTSSAIAALEDDAASVREAAIDILSRHAHVVDFDGVSRRLRSHPVQRVRRDLLRLLPHAPKWQAAVLLLEVLAHADHSDEEARIAASDALDRWVDMFNRTQTQPTAPQLQRIRALLELDAAVLHLSKKTARMLRFVTAGIG